MRKPDLTQIYMNVAEVPYVTVPSQIRDIIEDTEAISVLLSAPGTSTIGIRDQVILVILYDTAIRADELIGLNLSDVVLTSEEPYLRIHGKGDKERVVPLTDLSIPLIRQYISLYHPNHRDNEMSFICTVIKGRTDRMSERSDNNRKLLSKFYKKLRRFFLKFDIIGVKIFAQALVFICIHFQ